MNHPSSISSSSSSSSNSNSNSSALRPPPSAFPPPSSILIRGVNWIGDAVMTLPAVQRLKELWPQASIAMHAPSKLSGLWLQNPFLDYIYWPHDDPIPVGGFDLAVVFPNSFRSVLQTSTNLLERDFLTFGRKTSPRIGYVGHWPRKYLLTDIVPEEFRAPPLQYSKTPPLQIHHYLGLVKYLGGNAEPCPPKIYLRPDELDTAATKFSLHSSPLPLLALCPGAEYGPAKCWLPDRYAEVAKRVRAETGCQWILVGGPADRAVGEEIAAKLGDDSINLAGKTTLRELCAVLAQCKLLLTNDTGPMHLASAVGTKVVALFGSTDPVATGPYGEGHTIIRHPVECSPCFLRECPIDFRCMTRIGVEEVVQAVLKTTNGH